MKLVFFWSNQWKDQISWRQRWAMKDKAREYYSTMRCYTFPAAKDHQTRVRTQRAGRKLGYSVLAYEHTDSGTQRQSGVDPAEVAARSSCASAVGFHQMPPRLRDRPSLI